MRVDGRGPDQGPGAVRRAFWLRTPDGDRACWLHLPAAGRCRAAGVVVCPPVGHEYTHSHRTLRRLADRLAGMGVPALRLDYYGCGSSPGTTLDEGVVEAWVADVRAAGDFVARLTGGPATLVGLRLGATLACLATSHASADHLVAWVPVTSGRRYLRELRALSGTGLDPESGGQCLEAGGAALGPSVVGRLGAIDLARVRCHVTGRALVVERDDLSRPGALAPLLRDQGVVVDELTAPGYVAMLDKPHASTVPEQALDTIVDWLSARTRGREVSSIRLDALPTIRSTGASAVEELVEVPGDPPLFGVLTTPRQPDLRRRPLLLLPNAGSAHSAGPNRIYVEIARAAADGGFATLRVDLRNLGDSAAVECAEENHPYPSTAAADIGRSLEWLRRARGFERVVLGGLCSGAYHAFSYGRDFTATGAHDERWPRGAEPRSAPVEGLLLINPLTFRWRPGDSLATPGEARYHASLRDPRKWRKLRSGAYRPRQIVDFAGRAALRRAAGVTRRCLEPLGLAPEAPLGRELRSIAAAGSRVDLIFSRFDPGHELLLAQARSAVDELAAAGSLTVTTIDGADHTFTARAARQALLPRVVERLRAYGDQVPRLANLTPAPGTLHATPV